MSENTLRKVLVSLEEIEIECLDEIKREKGFRSRSFAVGQIIRDYYTRNKEKKMSNE